MLPFTLEEFVAVFVRYNEAVWPAPVLLPLIAVAALIAAGRRPRGTGSRVLSETLAFLSLWTGMLYHWMFFTSINQAAFAFGLLFVLQGVLIAHAGFARPALTFRPTFDTRGIVGGVLIGYALVLYPLLGLALGHRYPASPTFGAPCPTTLFTFGALLWVDRQVVSHRRLGLLLVAPVLWSIVGTSAALQLGMYEDLMLPVAAVVSVALFVRRGRGEFTADGGLRRVPAAR